MAKEKIALGLIVMTSGTCVIRGIRRPSIPTLVWPDGIDEPASDWFRYLSVDLELAAGSVGEYANILRPFLRFCRERGRGWTTVDDAFLTIWRDHLRHTMKLGVARINTSLQTIFAFYKWAEETKRLRFHVGIYVPGDLPVALQDVTFAISAKQHFSKGRHGKVFGSWSTPLTLSNSGASSRMRHTPTNDEIEDLHADVAERPMGERDSLIFSWKEDCGPRRFELNTLRKDQLPTIDQLDQLIERDEPWIIDIVRKGRKAGELRVLPELVFRTLDHIDHGRRQIVESFKGVPGYKEPPEVFLSSKTGMALHLDSITSLGRRSFKAVGIENSSIHRLRARYAVRTIEGLLDALLAGDLNIGSMSNWAETILVKAAEQMGHSSPASLRPYLTYAFNRRMQTSEAVQATKVSDRIRQLQLHEETLIGRLKGQRGLQEAARLLQAGKSAEASAALARLSQQLG
ncbi:site-specific integrase [Sphingomonas sp.]|jgi:integrase|uniref:site-specific integrase n=1 Tax=Sphingomonas sp. TaxID=28214 RepID=UPI001ECECCF7|nr:site-specific integrase [Sphingomonas sp.]MBX3595854.1 site-specific integrase [Sphingomonas sp.]